MADKPVMQSIAKFRHLWYNEIMERYDRKNLPLDERLQVERDDQVIKDIADAMAREEAAVIADIEHRLDVPDRRESPLDDIDLSGAIDREFLRDTILARLFEMEADNKAPDIQTTEVSQVPFGAFLHGKLSGEILVRTDGLASGWIEVTASDDEELVLPRLVRNPETDIWSDGTHHYSDQGVIELLEMRWPIDAYDSSVMRHLSDAPTKAKARDIATLLREQLLPHAEQSSTLDQYVHHTFDEQKGADTPEPLSKTTLAIKRICVDNEVIDFSTMLDHDIYRRFGDTKAAVIISALACIDATNNIALETSCRDTETKLRSTLPLKNENDIILGLLEHLNILSSHRFSNVD